MRLRTGGKLALVCLCAALSGMGTSCSSSSSGSKNGGGSGEQTGLQFTSPTTSPTVEVANPAQTVSLAVNESVTWSLQSGCGQGKPVGTLSNETATTATYSAPATGSNASQPCNPWQDTIVATSASNASATLGVVVVQTPPGIANVTSSSFTGELCTYNGGPCCPAGSVTCCPQPSITTIITPPNISGQFGIAQLGQFSDIGPITASGGVPPYTWQIISGSLPQGLSLVPGSTSLTRSITGTPIGLGCSTVALQVTDSTGVSSPSGPYTFNFVVIPASLKITVPNTPAAYNNPAQNGDPGVAYAPLALSTSGGTPPYAWVQDPVNAGYTLPPDLALSASSLTTVVIEGTPSAGADAIANGQGASAGLYPTQVQVHDSQLPYPAVGLTTLPLQDLAVPTACSLSNQAGPIQPQGIAVNGGTSSGGSVSAESYLQGSLAFLLRGFDNNGPVVIAGSIAVDGNGGISGGEEDVTRSSGSQHLTIEPTSTNAASYYVVGTTSAGPGNPGSRYTSYSRGCMALATSAGTATFTFTLAGCSNHWTEHTLTTTNDNACGMTQNSGGSNIAAGYFTTGRVIEFDDCTPGAAPYCTSSTRASGILRWQDSSSFSTGLSGPYAFGLSGWDAAAARYAMAGSFQAGSTTMSSVAADVNDAGTLSAQLTGGSGTYSSIDAYGNGTGTLSAGQVNLPVSIYIVSRGEAFLVTNSSGGAAPIIGGEAVTTASSFSNASLQNTQMFHLGGVTSGTADVSIGVLTFDGIGTISGTEYQDQAGTVGTTAISGTYTVDAKTGRAIFSAEQQGQSLGPHPFVAYLVPAPANLTRQSCTNPATCFTGFLMGTDSSAQDGVLEFQTPTTAPPPPFSNVYLAGDYAYGTDEILDLLTPTFEGVVYALPSGASTTTGSLGSNPAASQAFVQDVSYSCSAPSPQPNCVLLPSQLLSGSYSIKSNGTGTFGGGTVAVTNGNVTFYIDESPVNLHPSIVVVEQ
jgi:hypothetical protein